MKSSTIDERITKRNRITRVERAIVFSRVKKPHEYLSEIHVFYSKIILAKAYNNPKHGAKKLSGLLVLEGIFLSPNFIYKILLKHNLNRSSFRKSWRENLKKQKETNP